MTEAIIKDIERRAETINLTLSRLCTLANVDRSLVLRWKHGGGATREKFSEVENQLTRTLNHIEQKIFRELYPRHGRMTDGK